MAAKLRGSIFISLSKYFVIEQIYQKFYSVLEFYNVAFVSLSKKDAMLCSQAACHGKASLNFLHNVQVQYWFYIFSYMTFEFFQIALLASSFIKKKKQ